MASTSRSKASAPGSLMLLGEHAVLHGRRALACAVNRRITVTLQPRTDRDVAVVSALGSLRTTVDNLAPTGPFRFVCAALRSAALPHGVDVTIESEFSDQVGLGSSAAVTVATLAAAGAMTGHVPSPSALHEQSLGVIHAVQGVGSGTDAAASILGGIVGYRTTPRELHRLPKRYPLGLVYCGFKTPTVDVIALVEERRRENPGFYDALFNEMDASIDDAMAAIQRDDWAELGIIFNANQGYLEHLGVTNDELDEIVAGMRASPDVLGAKISGSGLGDCAVALGSWDAWDLPYPEITVEISEEGVHVD